MQQGGVPANHEEYTEKRLESFINSLTEQSNYINAIFKLIELRKLYL